MVDKQPWIILETYSARRTLVEERVNMVIIGKYQFEIDPHLKLDDN